VLEEHPAESGGRGKRPAGLVEKARPVREHGTGGGYSILKTVWQPHFGHGSLIVPLWGYGIIFRFLQQS